MEVPFPLPWGKLPARALPQPGGSPEIPSRSKSRKAPQPAGPMSPQQQHFLLLDSGPPREREQLGAADRTSFSSWVGSSPLVFTLSQTPKRSYGKKCSLQEPRGGAGTRRPLLSRKSRLSVHLLLGTRLELGSREAHSVCPVPDWMSLGSQSAPCSLGHIPQTCGGGSCLILPWPTGQ